MTMQQERGKGAGRMKWVLGVSLALNLVFVGLIAGSAYRFHAKDAERHGADARPQSYGAAFARALPREARRQLRNSLRESGLGTDKGAERELLFTQMIALLRADEFDRAAAQEILQAQAKTAVLMQGRAQAGWLTLVSEMDAEARRTMALELEDALRRGFKKRKPRQ
ncbi:MAG: periplasmic heavy metal sensor [Sulfitobacter sp.]